MPTISISGPGSLAEGTGGTNPFNFSVTRSGDTTGSSLVDYWLWAEGYGAEPNLQDVSGATAGTVYFQPGDTQKTVVINVVGDSTVEANEIFNVSLSNPRGATLETSFAQATIVNDDGSGPPSTSLSWGNPGGVHRNEGSQTSNSAPTDFVYVLNRTGDLSSATTADWAVIRGPVDESDFTAPPHGRVSFAPGETSKEIVLKVNGDLAVEPDEAFRLELTNVVGATAPPANSGTIINDDGGATGPTSVSIGDLAPKAEGTGGTTPFNFTVTRSGDTSGFSLVDYWLWPTSGGGAGEANQFDFEGPTTGTIYFSPGESTRQLDVTVRGDAALEPNETFNVSLSNPRGTAIGDGAAQTTIVNDDGGASTSLSWGNPGGVHRNEGSQTSNSAPTDFVYVLNRTGDVSGATTADWAVIRGPVDESDFVSPPFGRISFAPGEVSKEIVLKVNGDLAVEPDEAFRLELTNVVGATAPPANSGTIINDDGGATGPTTVSITGSIERAEGSSGSTPWDYLVTRSGDLSGSTLVDYFVIGDVTGPQASSSPDYYGGTGTLVFQAGETQKTIRMEIVGDTVAEPNESFTLGLSNGRGATIEGGPASGRILDDDGWVMG